MARRAGLVGPREGLIQRPGRVGPVWELEGSELGSKELAPVDSGAGTYWERPRIRESGCSSEKSVVTYLL